MEGNMSPVTQEDLDPRELKKWKVGRRYMYMEVDTVQAHDPNEAIQKIKDGFGRHAGRTPPVLVDFMVKEADGDGGLADGYEMIEKPKILTPSGKLHV